VKALAKKKDDKDKKDKKEDKPEQAEIKPQWASVDPTRLPFLFAPLRGPYHNDEPVDTCTTEGH
jgi:hypothetical protein